MAPHEYAIATYKGLFFVNVDNLKITENMQEFYL